MLVVVVLLSLAPSAGQAAEYSLGALREVAASGAPGLALALMNDSQPAAADAPDAWAEWERTRIEILAGARAWRRAIDRLQSLPAAAPETFRRWALERRAAFLLELDAPSAARALLRQLLWSAGPGADADELRGWRRLVVRSYLVEGRVDDAVTALRRFDQDYHDTSSAWAVLRTRVLLRAGRADEAAARLPEDQDDPELAALALLARLRAGQVPPAAAWHRATEAAQLDGTAPQSAARMWFVAAQAAGAQSSPAERALATERAAALATSLPASDNLFAIHGDALWSAWLAYGTWVGNNRQLLIGDDTAWFKAASDSMPRYPVRARSLLAVVSQQGEAGARRRAHERLVSLLAEGEPGMAAARQAYLHASRYPTTASIPENVRYRLVDDALARDDLDLATRLLAELRQAPEDVDPFDWQLLRARVLVLGGRTDDGAAALNAILGDNPDLSGKALDRFLQVVFDLQGANEDKAALRLLQRLSLRELPGQRQRELLYWRAESQESLERYERAAELYLRSATLLDGRGGDPWGQTARYHAAGMLAKAGLISDARRIYQDLLRVTDDKNRRATLRHRLQQLGLREAAPGNLPPEAGSGS